MSDGDGAAFGNLATENRNHRTVGAEDVAEAGGDKLCCILLEIKRLHVNLGDALGGTHHVGRVDGLVGGDHHELLHPVLDSEVGEAAGALHVGFDGGAHVLFHHRHMLVRGGVIDDGRTFTGDDFLHLGHITDVHDFYVNVFQPVGRITFVAKEEDGRFGVVDEDEAFVAVLHHLPHDFAADGAGRAGNQHRFAKQVFFNTFRIQDNLAAFQQLLDFHLLDLLETQLAVDPLNHRRHDKDLCSVLQTYLGDFVFLAGRKVLDSDNHEINAVFRKIVAKKVIIKHFHVLNFLAHFGRVAVEKRQYIIFTLGILVEGAFGGESSGSRPHDDDIALVLGRIHRFKIQHLESQTVKHHPHHGNEELHHYHGVWHDEFFGAHIRDKVDSHEGC